MDFKSYTNPLKALIHIHKSTKSFNNSLRAEWEGFSGLIRINVDVDLYDACVEVKYFNGTDDERIFNLRLYNMKDVEREDASYCSATDESYPSINYVELDPNNIILYNRGTPRSNRLVYKIDTLHQEHFQNSTLWKDNTLEFYLYLDEMYKYYNDFVPTMTGLSIRYNSGESIFKSDEFIEWVTKKLWGVTSLI